jgi:hypothetical protein
VDFVSLLVPFGKLIQAAGPKGPHSGGGIMAAIILWSVASPIFFIANAGLAIGSIARGRSATKPVDRVRPADRLYRPPLGFGVLPRAVMAFRPDALSAVTMFASASGSEGKGRDEGLQLFLGHLYFR